MVWRGAASEREAGRGQHEHHSHHQGQQRAAVPGDGGGVAAVKVTGGQATLDALFLVLADLVLDVAAVLAPVRVAAVPDKDLRAVLCNTASWYVTTPSCRGGSGVQV